MAYSLPPFIAAAKSTPPSQAPPQHRKSAATRTSGFGVKKKDPVWQCVQNCGACCKLDKGPNFPSPDEIFDEPSDIKLYKSLVGEDGWCIHYDKSLRKCSIYDERPYFCRVEPEIFHTLYGIDKRKFNKEACRYNQSCAWNTVGSVGKVQPCHLEHQLEMMNFVDFVSAGKGVYSSFIELQGMSLCVFTYIGISYNQFKHVQLDSSFQFDFEYSNSINLLTCSDLLIVECIVRTSCSY